MSTTLFFTLVGSILFLGVLGNFFFSRTHIPSSVILMTLGIVLGPVAGFLTGSDFQSIAPYFGNIALILILFQGGLEIDLFEAIGQARSAFLMGLTQFLFVAFGVVCVAHFFLQVELKAALFYGLVLGGTSPAVILPIISSLKLSSRGKALYSLEVVFVEVLTVVTTILAIDFVAAKETPSALSATFFVLNSIGVATWIAILAAWAWNWAIPFIEKAGMNHSVTLAFLFILYAVASSMHAEPAITILLFGLLLENGHHVSDWIKKVTPSKVHRWVDFPVKNEQRLFSTLFHELSFLVRTFFFVLVGLLFDFSMITPIAYGVGALFILVFVMGRYVSLNLLKLFDPSIDGQESRLGMVTLPRGLATAVMAIMVNQAKVPGTELLLPIAFLSILGTNLLMVIFLRLAKDQTN